MKWYLILLIMGATGDPGIKDGVPVGPYDEQAGCIAVGKLMETKKGFQWECVPTGLIPLKKPEPKEEAPTDKKPEKKPK